MIDAHVHFWRPARGDDILILRRRPELARDVLPEVLRPLLDAAGIRRAVVVQAAPAIAETEWLLALTAELPWIAGVVGWADLESPDLPRTLDRLQAAPKFRGLRAMLHRIDDPAWIARPAVAPGLAELARRGLSLDLIARPEHLDACRRALAATPDLIAIVDHGGGPPIAARGWEPWASGIAALARETAAACKFSGLLEEAAPGAGADALEPFARHLDACFGPDRLLWSSNWPVVDLVGGYADWRAIAETLIGRLGLPRAAVMGATARRVYRIG